MSGRKKSLREMANSKANPYQEDGWEDNEQIRLFRDLFKSWKVEKSAKTSPLLHKRPASSTLIWMDTGGNTLDPSQPSASGEKKLRQVGCNVTFTFLGPTNSVMTLTGFIKFLRSGWKYENVSQWISESKITNQTFDWPKSTIVSVFKSWI